MSRNFPFREVLLHEIAKTGPSPPRLNVRPPSGTA